MDWRTDPGRWGALALAVAATALGWWFGDGLHPVWWVMWLAPLPVLWLAPRLRWMEAASIAFVAVAIGGMDQWTYLHDRIGLPLPVIVRIVVLPALGFSVCVWLFRHLVTRGRPMAASLLVPAAWVAMEYANAASSPHGTFGSLAYTQMDALPLLQLAAITGLWGITFVILWLPSAIAVAFAPALAARRWIPLTTVAAMLIAVLGYGAWRMQQPAIGIVRVGLLSLEHPVRPPLASTEGQSLLQRYLVAVGALADQGAKIVVLPETIVATPAPTIPALADLAHQRGLMLDAGIEYQGEPPGERNVSMVFQPTADAPVSYSKHHLIPFFEDRYRPGSAYRVIEGMPDIGLAICKDMDFHDIGAAYANLGAQLLLVPAWDFGVDGWLHGRMAIMRGVESGFAVARTARSGRLTLSDARGRVVAEASSEQHDAMLVGNLPLHRDSTLYARWGDWFALADLALLAMLLMLACRPRSGLK